MCVQRRQRQVPASAICTINGSCILLGLRHRHTSCARTTQPQTQTCSFHQTPQPSAQTHVLHQSQQLQTHARTCCESCLSFIGQRRRHDESHDWICWAAWMQAHQSLHSRLPASIVQTCSSSVLGVMEYVAACCFTQLQVHPHCQWQQQWQWQQQVAAAAAASSPAGTGVTGAAVAGMSSNAHAALCGSRAYLPVGEAGRVRVCRSLTWCLDRLAAPPLQQTIYSPHDSISIYSLLAPSGLRCFSDLKLPTESHQNMCVLCLNQTVQTCLYAHAVALHCMHEPGSNGGRFCKTYSSRCGNCFVPRTLTPL